MTLTDFENAEDWTVSTLLGVGDHVVTINSAEGSTTKNGNPQIELEVGNENGTRRDWLVYNNDIGVRKVATLFRAAGKPLKNEDAEGGILKDEVITALVGEKVTATIALEDKYNGEPGEKVPRIQGYTPADLGPASAAKSDDDIQF